MKAAPADQLRLLDLQAHDLALDQLAHRRRTLLELAEIQRVDQLLGTTRNELVHAQTAVDDLDRQIRRLETDIDQVRQRAARDRQRMDAGAANSKELEKLQHEVESLARRQSELEDSELELMEERETAEAHRDELQGRVDELTASLDGAEQRRDSSYTEIDEAANVRTSERGSLAAQLPADLLSLYEKIRATNGGIGAAALQARRCQGCRLELAGTHLAEVKAAAADEVVRCEECRRILVRTPEAGL